MPPSFNQKTHQGRAKSVFTGDELLPEYDTPFPLNYPNLPFTTPSILSTSPVHLLLVLCHTHMLPTHHPFSLSPLFLFVTDSSPFLLFTLSLFFIFPLSLRQITSVTHTSKCFLASIRETFVERHE